jgi:hypothetical protein
MMVPHPEIHLLQRANEARHIEERAAASLLDQLAPQLTQSLWGTCERQGQSVVLVGRSERSARRGLRRMQQAGANASRKSVAKQRDHRNARPQDIDSRRVRVVRKRVERQIGQLQARQMIRPSLDSRCKDDPPGRRRGSASFRRRS